MHQGSDSIGPPTFLAWTGSPGGVEHRLDRVRTALGLDDDLELSTATVNGGRAGVAVWDPGDPLSRVPRWSSRHDGATVLLDEPVGATKLTGTTPGPGLAERLGATCRRDPAGVAAAIAPPFCLIDLDTQTGRLLIVNDGIGMTRLYQRRAGGLWTWSNRAAALHAFTGETAEIDREAWAQFAVCGWFPGTGAAYAGTTRVPPSTVIDAPANRHPSIGDSGALSAWTARHTNTPAAGEAAAGLQAYVRDLGRLTAGPYRVMLSGGRDSRVVAAAALAAKLPLELVTLGPIEGEIATARQLVSLLDAPADHQVPPADPSGARDPLYGRILGLHRQFDGDFPHVLLGVRRRAGGGDATTLVGAGGEIAHAKYYPSHELRERLERSGPRASIDRLDRHFRQAPGATEAGYDAVSASLGACYDRSRSLGIEGPGFLDFFYLVERFRRWAPAAQAPNSHPVLAAPEFIRATFDMTPADRVDARLHRDVVATLVPAWADVPFFQATAAHRSSRSERKLRLWQGEAAEEVDGLLADTQAWGDAFDVDGVTELWATARREGLANRFEGMFQRVLWRRVFEDHLADVNRRIADSA